MQKFYETLAVDQTVLWNDPRGLSSGEYLVQRIETESGRVDGPLNMVWLTNACHTQCQALAGELEPAPGYWIASALEHVVARHPLVVSVTYDQEGHWDYAHADGTGPTFTLDEDVFLLQCGSDEAHSLGLTGTRIRRFLFSCMKTMSQLQKLWSTLADIPVTEDGQRLDEGFLHFEAGASVEDVWHWFEQQHPSFVVGEAQVACS